MSYLLSWIIHSQITITTTIKFKNLAAHKILSGLSRGNQSLMFVIVRLSLKSISVSIDAENVLFLIN